MATVFNPRIPFQHRLTVRLTAAVIGVLLVIGSPFLLAFHTLRRGQQLEALAEATNSLSEIVVDSLRSTMLAGKPHLLDDAVRRIAAQEHVSRAMILDHRSQIRVSSDPDLEGQVRHRALDPECAVCHGPESVPPASRTAVVHENGQRVLRSMTVIRNESSCHTCHDPTNRVNGILLMDFALGTADRQFFADIGRTVLLGTVMVLLTIAVLVWLLRRMVHGPLGEVVDASRRIVEGDLDARAAVPGAGEFSQLGSQVNRMTAHLSSSLRTVETQRRELQAILDAIDDEIVVLDSDQCVIAANEAFRRGAGRTGTELRGRRCPTSPTAVPDSHDETAQDRPVERVFRTGRSQKGIYSQMRPDGRELVTEVYASPLRGSDGTVDRAVEVRRDISERRQMEALAAQSERLASLGLLASGLSHEINNPLGAIATSVEGLRRRLSLQPGLSSEATRMLEEVLSRVAREVDRGRAITHRLLKVARPSDGRRGLADINHVVEDIVALLSHDIKRSGISMRLELGELPTLRMDDAQLGQVVMNLSMNAIQAMADGGGELRIATSTVNGVVEMKFEDTGCGIPATLSKRVFEPFFTTKPPGKGTGLGLFITHQIVSDLGGTIGLRSAPGQGASFTVRLPRNGSAQEQ